MKTLVKFVLIAVFLSSGNLFSQHESFYFHRTFHGTINGKLKVEVNLTCEDTLLFGKYKYVNVGKWISLKGHTIEVHDSGITKFFLEEFSDGKMTGNWVGEISHAGKVKGKWMAPKGKTQLDVSLQDLHPELSVVFEKYEYYASAIVAEYEGEQKMAESNCQLIWPMRVPALMQIQKLQEDILELQFPKHDENVKNPQQALRNATEIFIADVRGYYSENASSDYPYMMDEYEDRSMSVVLNQDGIVTLDFFMNGFTGGAHPYYSSEYKCWDLLEMKILKWDDIFIPQALDSLRKRINQDAEVNGEADNFLVDEIDPLEADIVLEEDGIRFFYDVYEVTPYVLGSWEIFYNWQELLPLLKSDSPVQRLIHSD